MDFDTLQTFQPPNNQALPRKTAMSDPALKRITAPGTSNARTSQACDRCRAKKSKCDGKLPACSTCAAVGIKCIVSDKLSRRSFPKGYTETLEERVRQLEAENTKLQGLVALRDEQLSLTAALNADALQHPENPSKLPLSGAADLPNAVLHSHNHEEGCPCGSGPLNFHDRPVSMVCSLDPGTGMAYSVSDSVLSEEELLFDRDDDTNSIASVEGLPGFSTRDFQGVSFNRATKEARPAPGAFAAATAIEQMQRNRHFHGDVSEENNQQLLTHLVALSIPRSTEETLFIPTLLARICQVYGYDSPAARLTARALASLKDKPVLPKMDPAPLALIMDRPDVRLSEGEACLFVRSIELPKKVDLDYHLTVYFQDWGNVCPIINKDSFLGNYVRLTQILETGHSTQDSVHEPLEKTAALLVLVVALALLLKRYTQPDSTALAARFDDLIHAFIKPNCILTKQGSLQSLQVLTLALQYCLATGDYVTCYELRGRVVSMAQQLRLHRCPAAVLGLSRDVQDIDHQNFLQGDRRILFWCIYCLDTYCSVNLGVPRLLKDTEIECAMPFCGNDTSNENILIINNTKLTIFGKVSKMALAFMQFCKVQGNIVDSIFSRSGNFDVQEKALEKDQILDCWRRDLPTELKFEIDINGFSLKDPANSKLNDGCDGTNWNSYTKQQLTLIYLFYHAKTLIYMPIISKHGYHRNVGLSMKEKLLIGQRDISTNATSMTMIQQSAIRILELLKTMALQFQHCLPVPTNLPREHARFALLVAKGSLDYIKGGSLHQDLKALLMRTIELFKREMEICAPSSLTHNSTVLLEYAILSVLGSLKGLPSRKKAAVAPQYAVSFAPVSVPEPVVKTEAEFGIDDFDNFLNSDALESLNMPNEFFTDGSLGLVPFLNENGDDERLSDRAADDGAFQW